MPTPRDGCNAGRHGRVMQFPSLDNESAITQYFAYRVTTGRRWRTQTVKSRSSQVRALAAYLDPTPLVDATEEQILVWQQQLTGQPETIAAHISAARGLYRWMAVYSRPRLRQDDPTVILERPRIPTAQPRPMLDRHYDLAPTHAPPVSRRPRPPPPPSRAQRPTQICLCGSRSWGPPPPPPASPRASPPDTTTPPTTPPHPRTPPERKRKRAPLNPSQMS